MAGYAEKTAPVDSNDSEEGRARNRRVDLVILSEEGLKSEPGGKYYAFGCFQPCAEFTS